MEKYLEVIRRTLELSGTVLEGLEHIKYKLDEGDFESTITLFHDVVEAFYQMEKSIPPLMNQLPQNQLSDLTAYARESFENVVSLYENHMGIKALEMIRFSLIPAYQKWKAELERVFTPYVVS